MDCDEETLRHLMNTVKRVANHGTETCGYDGANLPNASDEGAGQSVPHFHIHIISRKQGDGIQAWPAFSWSTLTREELYQKLKIGSLGR